MRVIAKAEPTFVHISKHVRELLDRFQCNALVEQKKLIKIALFSFTKRKQLETKVGELSLFRLLNFCLVKINQRI